MLLVKKCQFFHYLFSLKIKLETRFNNVLDRKKTFSDCKKKKFLSLKNRIFPKGLTHAFGEKMQFFYYSFSAKIRLEIRFNNVLDFFFFLFSLKIRLEMRFDNVLDRKETFF